MERKKVYCSQCDDKVDYVVSLEEITQKVKEKEYTLVSKVPRCIHCQNELFVEEIDSEVQQMFFDLYRQDHQLPTVNEIVTTRKELDLNQRDFSRLLGFGEITISRYELGSIPNSSSSILIKNVLDPTILKKLYQDNKEKLSLDGQTNIEKYLQKHDDLSYTGNTKFNSRKLYEVVHRFALLADQHHEIMYPTKMNKLLFYADFNSFSLRGKGITGSIYLKFEHGPVPQYYDYHYYMNSYIEMIIKEERTLIKANDVQYESVLDPAEIAITNAVYSYFSKHNGAAISKLSHDEEAYRATKDGTKISYHFANQLLIKV